MDFIERLLAKFNIAQTSNNCVPSGNCQDRSDIFPMDIMKQLMLIMDVDTLLNTCSTNVEYNSICSNEDFWEQYVMTNFPLFKGKLYNGSWKETAINLSTAKRINVVTSSGVGISPDTMYITANLTIFDIYKRIYTQVKNEYRQLKLYHNIKSRYLKIETSLRYELSIIHPKGVQTWEKGFNMIREKNPKIYQPLYSLISDRDESLYFYIKEIRYGYDYVD